MCFPEKPKPPNPIEKKATNTPPCHRIGLGRWMSAIFQRKLSMEGELGCIEQIYFKDVCMIFPTFCEEVKEFLVLEANT